MSFGQRTDNNQVIVLWIGSFPAFAAYHCERRRTTFGTPGGRQPPREFAIVGQNENVGLQRAALLKEFLFQASVARSLKLLRFVNCRHQSFGADAEVDCSFGILDLLGGVYAFEEAGDFDARDGERSIEGR